MPDTSFKGGLKRLPPEYYRGHAWVHWSMTIKGRRTGWLSELMHRALREAMLHSLARYGLLCPVYCFMPDHGHFLWGGLRAGSDQLRAAAFFRQEWNRLLGMHAEGVRLQKQGHDHVLAEKERQKEEFEASAYYILDNPVRAGLVHEFGDWPHLGALAPGFPRLDPRMDDFWGRLWKIYHSLLDA